MENCEGNLLERVFGVYINQIYKINIIVQLRPIFRNCSLFEKVIVYLESISSFVHSVVSKTKPRRDHQPIDFRCTI